MSWLTQTHEPADYDPHGLVGAFITKHHIMGAIVLSAWNEADPLSCYYGDDCNPDEYLGYAERFIEGLERILPEERKRYPHLIAELVRRSFYPSQVCYDPKMGRAWAPRSRRRKITRLITEGIAQAGINLEEW